MPFDVQCSIPSAQIVSTRDRLGRPIAFHDAQIAAACLLHRTSLATRNIKDFDGTGVDLINLWLT